MHNRESGQSLIELMVVIAIVGIIVAGLTFATIGSIRNASFAKNQAEATKYAQEGIERVRAGRDRNDCINGLSTTVNSWNDGNSSCSNSGSIWNYQIYNGCGSGGSCYLKFSSSTGGALTWIATSNSFPASFAETVGQFKRAVILFDFSSSCTIPMGTAPCYKVEKNVTVIVTWTDFSGTHQSTLSTILRKI